MKDKKTTGGNRLIHSLTTSITVRRIFALAITSGVCVIITWLILFTPQEVSLVKNKVAVNDVRPVTVIQAKPGTYQTKIETYGEVSPEWKVAIKSKVQGGILEVSDQFRIGNTVKKGDLLLAVEQSDYRVQLSEAMLELRDAKTKLLIEQKEGQDALESWKRSGLDQKNVPSSPLLLRKPYLEMAEANLTAAKEKVNQAKLFIDYTRIKAPFDALVVERHVSLGGTLFSGDEVGTLYGMKTFVVALHIGKREWKKLSEEWQGMAVQLFDDDSDHQWTGKLMREGRLFENDSRLRTMFVEIDEPLQQTPPLLPGNFVKAEIPGRAISGLLRIPDSARTQKGLVWYLDDDNLLQSVQANPVFREKGYLYFKYQKDDVVSIVVNPNNSFVNGLKVTPVVIEEQVKEK